MRHYSCQSYLLFLVSSLFPSLYSLHCNISDPLCQARFPHNLALDHKPQPNKCHYQNIWLIAGTADDNCGRPDSKKLLQINSRDVSIRPEIIRLPGCFTVEIANLLVLDSSELINNSFFIKAEYQWWNLEKFSRLQCQNASNNGCGGYGNNCYYCDICNSLTAKNRTSHDHLADHFNGINCPTRAGYYTFSKEFCFNDWSVFDKDGDCQFDFFQTGEGLDDYRTIFASLQQIGFGTLVAKFRLAHNATGDILKKRTMKEKEIERIVRIDMEMRRQKWTVDDAEFARIRDWNIDYSKDVWHRDEYLPWLLYENEIACIRVTFNICDRKPSTVPNGSFGRNADRKKYFCN